MIDHVVEGLACQGHVQAGHVCEIGRTQTAGMMGLRAEHPYAQLKGNWGLVHARVTLAAPQDASVTPCELGGSARKSPRPACQGCHQRPSPFEPCRNWSSMKNGKPLFHHVLQCVSCWKKELPDGDRRQGRRDYTKCP